MTYALPALPPPPTGPYAERPDGPYELGHAPEPEAPAEADDVPPGVKLRMTVKQNKALDMLQSDATDIALGGGSRSGKTFLLVYALMYRALMYPGSRHAIFRFRLNAVVASILYDTLPKVCEIAWPGLWKHCRVDKQHWFIELPNGSEIWFGGLDEKDRTEKILGLEFATIYFNESSQIPYSSIVLAHSRLAQTIEGCVQRAYYDFNPPSKRHWTFKVFVLKVDPDNARKPLKDAMLYQFMYINPMDNADNLTAAYLRRLENMPLRAKNRFLLGKFADEAEGTLWDEAVIDATRIRSQKDLPAFVRIVIGVDPSGASGDADLRSDEIGIVVVALGSNGHAYVLEDLSGKYGPAEWSEIIGDAWDRHGADCIVAEINFGGAMVEGTINALGKKDLNVKQITASRGKVVRAEPIANLYHRSDMTGGIPGKVHHVGEFPELEQQMCDFTPAGYQGPSSPDRVDAQVFALSELFPGIIKPREDVRESQRQPPPKTMPRSASAYSRRR